MAEFFASLGYVVAYPLRRGYGETGGTFAEGGSGFCSTNTEFASAGYATADDIEAVVKSMTARKTLFVTRPSSLATQAAGGEVLLSQAGVRKALPLTSISLAGMAPEKESPTANPGMGRSTAAVTKFGKSARQPMLWLYVENDTFIGPSLARRMHEAFTRAGGKARLELMLPYENEGHYLFSDDGISVWGPVIEKWLTRTSPS